VSRHAHHVGAAAGDWLPDYLDQVPALQLLDPLGALLTGNPDPRPVSYRFADAVKLSGHCCPTVAGAWTLLLAALGRLWQGRVRALLLSPELRARAVVEA